MKLLLLLLPLTLAACKLPEGNPTAAPTYEGVDIPNDIFQPRPLIPPVHIVKEGV